MATTALALEEVDWQVVADRARRRRQWTMALLYALLIVASLPIIIPYLWLFTMAFSARGGTSTLVLWRTLAVLAPALLALLLLNMSIADPGRRHRAQLALLVVTIGTLAVFVGPHVHLQNWRFLWNPDFSQEMKYSPTGAGDAQFPSVWTAFSNSLALALAQMAIVVTVATLAGYYLSRFDFRGRENFLRSVLVLHAFPAMTLVIPIFLLMHWTGLLDTITGVVLVVCTLELPFAIFIMKGFFDAVPWDIEMSALTDGASRRQAFLQVVLPQVRNGILAVSVFTFIRGWEEYIFVFTFLIRNTNWTMSLYMYYVRDDVMGVDYGVVSAVGVFYLVPSLVLYAAAQRYLMQMSIGGVKG
jgi:inositol-phosphate transport system permease protein